MIGPLWKWGVQMRIGSCSSRIDRGPSRTTQDGGWNRPSSGPKVTALAVPRQPADLKRIVSGPHQLFLRAWAPRSPFGEAHTVGQLARGKALVPAFRQASAGLHGLAPGLPIQFVRISSFRTKLICRTST